MSHRFSDLERHQGSIRKTLVLGGARDKLPAFESLQASQSGDASVLNLLAVLAVRNKLGVVLPTDSLGFFGTDQEDVATPVKPVRDLLCGLFTAHNSYVTHAVPLATMDAMVQAKQIPHPYDYHKLEGWMKLDKHSIGQAAAAWLYPAQPSSQASGTTDYYASTDDDAPLSIEQLRDLPVSVVVQYVRDIRTKDAVEGLSLCAHFLPDQTAANRVKLLEALMPELSGSDVEFLSSCLEDRAASVKTQAIRLLAMIEGTKQYSSRLDNAREALNVGRKARLIGRGIQIDLNVPKSVSKTRRVAWVQDLFGGIDPLALCAMLELKSKEFCRGVGDPVLRRTLAISAVALEQDDIAAELIKELDLNERLSLISDAAFKRLNDQQKTAAWPMMLKGMKFASIEDLHWMLSSLYLALRQKPTSECFAEILTNRTWRAYRKQATKGDAECDPEVAELLTAIAPATERAEWEGVLARFSPAFSSRARRLNQLYSLLERSS